MSKLELYLLVGTGMWTAFCMVSFIGGFSLTPNLYFELGRFIMFGGISLPFFVYAYWRFNDKKKKIKLSETRDAMKQT